MSSPCGWSLSWRPTNQGKILAWFFIFYDCLYDENACAKCLNSWWTQCSTEFWIFKLISSLLLWYVFNWSVCAGIMLAGVDPKPLMMPWHDAAGIVLHLLCAVLPDEVFSCIGSFVGLDRLGFEEVSKLLGLQVNFCSCYLTTYFFMFFTLC